MTRKSRKCQTCQHSEYFYVVYNVLQLVLLAMTGGFKLKMLSSVCENVLLINFVKLS